MLGTRSLQYGPPACGWLCLLAITGSILSHTAASSCSAQELGGKASAIDLHELYYGVHLPRDRAVSRALDLAEELIAEGRYSESVPVLVGAIARDEDGWQVESKQQQAGASNEVRPSSLKNRAQQLLGKLPPAGQRAYALEVESKSQRLLRTALEQGDRRGAAALVRNYPHTKAAASALWFLASGASEQGDHRLSISLLERLGDSPHIASFQPQQSLMLALASLAEGDTQQFEATIERLSESRWREFELEGAVSLANPAAAKQWLRQLAGSQASASAAWHSQWNVPGGGPLQNPLRRATPPHPWARWTALTVVDPWTEDRLDKYADHLKLQGRPAVPACRSVAVGNVIVARTADSLMAIDLQSGRRIWETRPEMPRNDNAGPSRWELLISENQDRDQPNPLLLRVWYDAIASGVSSDGQRVYAIEPTPEKEISSEFGLQMAWQMRRRRIEAPRKRNQLSAFGLATEGKLLWAAGGKPGSPLENAYFLGVPHPITGPAPRSLAVLVELDQTICLAELNPQDGTPDWIQPLVSVERGVGQNTMRRYVGGAVAQSGNLLVCSTGAGVVVGVDLLNRSIAWVDRFPVDDERRTSDTMPWRRRPSDDWPKNAHRSWYENRVLIAGKQVYVATPESKRLHCIDLATGEPQWRSQAPPGAFLSAVMGDKVLLTTAETVEAYGASTGDSLWKIQWEGGAVLSGRSLALLEPNAEGQADADGKLIVPLSDGSTLVVDTLEGNITERIECWAGGGAGNLSFHNGSLFSLTHDSLDRFDERLPLLQAAQQQLEQQPADLAARCLVGEAALSDGQVDRAIDQFRQAYAVDRNSPLPRNRLRMAVAMRLEQSGPTADDLALLQELADSPHQHVALKVQEVSLAVANGDLPLATQIACEFATSRLASRAASREVVTCAAGHFATPARRIAVLLEEAWQGASTADRQTASQQIEATRSELGSLASTEQFTRLFGDLPCCADLPQTLAQQLASSGRPLDYQFQLAALAQQAGSAQQPGGMSVQPIFAQPPPGSQLWATRHVEVRSREVLPTASPQPIRRRRNADSWRHVQLETLVPPVAGGADSLLPGSGERLVRLAIHLGQGELYGFDGQGQTLLRSKLTGAAAGLMRRVKADNLPTVWQFGPCLFFETGDHVAALQAMPGAATLDHRLWSTEGLAYSLSRGGRERFRLPGSTWEPPSIDDSGNTKIIGVTAQGVIARKGGALMCLDPLRGTLQWLRSDLSLGDRAVVDDQFVYVTSSTGPRRKPQRVKLIDGSDAGEWQDQSGKWLEYRVGLLTTLQLTPKQANIRIVRLATGETVTSRSYDQPHKVAEVGDWGLAVLDGTGNLELLDTRTGQSVCRSRLNLRAKPASLEVVERWGRLVVVVGYPTPKLPRNSRLLALDEGVLATGDVFCLDRQTGESLWPRPAQIAGRGLLVRQPIDSPLLVFGSLRAEPKKGRTHIRTQLLVIDLWTGSTVHRDDDLDENRVRVYTARYESGATPRLELKLGSKMLTLTATDQPIAPAPPTTDPIEAPKTNSAIVDYAGQEVKRALDAAIQPKPAAEKPGLRNQPPREEDND